jgi:hypothetical protein
MIAACASFCISYRMLCELLHLRASQEKPNASTCERCPLNTGRRIGVKNASTRLACVCKEGDALPDSNFV